MAPKHSCSICLEDFTKPKILPCFHTFCEECLENHIKTHSKDNVFNCPNCRQQICVPNGGARDFTTNFYLEDNNNSEENQIFMCSKHKKKELSFFCRDCSKLICHDCVVVCHRNHDVDDIEDVDEEAKERLKGLEKELEKKILFMKESSSAVANRRLDLSNAATQACQIVDKQVEKICKEVKKQGDEVKSRINKLKDEEGNKLKKLQVDIDNYSGQLESSRNISREVLKNQSTVPLLDILPNVQSLATGEIPSDLEIPNVKYPYFHRGRLESQAIKHTLGKLQTMAGPTFSTYFNLNQMEKPDVNHSGEARKIRDLPWYVVVKHHTEKSSLAVFLHLTGSPGIKSCRANYTLKLMNKMDDSKTIAKQHDAIFTPDGTGRGWAALMDWDKFLDQSNGFLDSSMSFTVLTTIKITNIERY